MIQIRYKNYDTSKPPISGTKTASQNSKHVLLSKMYQCMTNIKT